MTQMSSVSAITTTSDADGIRSTYVSTVMPDPLTLNSWRCNLCFNHGWLVQAEASWQLPARKTNLYAVVSTLHSRLRQVRYFPSFARPEGTAAVA